ncbi:MAG: right-handed parallel beta-helix repeat-containing protein, partial [Pirellulales bacterium]
GLAAHSACALPLFASTEIHVSTQGSDNADGSLSAPVQTLSRAAELARQVLPGSSNSSVEVIVHEGEYFLTETLALGEQDSGTPDGWLVFRAADGEKVTLSGASTLERIGLAAEFEEYHNHLSTSAAQAVVVFRVPNTHQDAWSITARGEEHFSQPCSIELFADGSSLPRASFPASGWNVNSGETALAEQISHHAGEFAWLHGFPHNDYQDEFTSLQSAEDHNWREGARYRIENLLCQLDQPGEWYIDCENEKILWWPNGTDDTSLRVSNLETVVSLYDASHVRFDGFVIEGVRVQGIEIAGGNSCEIVNCEVRQAGNVGINVFHGGYHTISNCRIHSVGGSGIRIEGGNRDGQVPSDHLCHKNELFNCSTKSLARRAAIDIHGVAVSVTENEIYEQPDWAVSICGDSHTVQSNHIHHVCKQTSDTGAIYLSHDDTFSDNQILLNHIHHVGEFDFKNSFAIYLDDNVSNTQVSANWIHDASRAIVVRGGSENQIEANIIHDCWIGTQFQWSVDSTGNQLSSNVLEAENPLLVSEANGQALKTSNNLNSANHLFVNAREGNFEFTDKQLAERLGLNRWPLAKLPKGSERYVSVQK